MSTSLCFGTLCPTLRCISKVHDGVCDTVVALPSTGHSLGGALAVLAAYDLTAELGLGQVSRHDDTETAGCIISRHRNDPQRPLRDHGHVSSGGVLHLWIAEGWQLGIRGRLQSACTRHLACHQRYRCGERTTHLMCASGYKRASTNFREPFVGARRPGCTSPCAQGLILMHRD